MGQEIINSWNGEKIVLTISDDGFCFCPVCGEKARHQDWRPYDLEGHPSYDLCSCGFEYGFDDSGVPPYGKSWERYRQRWLNGEVNHHFANRLSKSQKMEQLKNLGIV